MMTAERKSDVCVCVMWAGWRRNAMSYVAVGVDSITPTAVGFICTIRRAATNSDNLEAATTFCSRSAFILLLVLNIIFIPKRRHHQCLSLKTDDESQEEDQ